jgi:predicted PurR-regulated permease PerM
MPENDHVGGGSPRSWLAQARRRARSRLASAEQRGGPPPFVADASLEQPGRIVVVDATASADESIPRGVVLAAAWAWRIILIVAAGFLLLRLVAALRIVVIPVVVALLLAALFPPVAAALRRRGMGHTVAAAVVLIGALVVVGGGLGLIIRTFVTQFDDLSDQVVQGLDEVRSWLSAGPLHLSQAQLDSALDQLQEQIAANRSTLTSGALSTASTVSEVVAGFSVVLFTLFFFLRDGGPIWQFLCRLLVRRSVVQLSVVV